MGVEVVLVMMGVGGVELVWFVGLGGVGVGLGVDVGFEVGVEVGLVVVGVVGFCGWGIGFGFGGGVVFMGVGVLIFILWIRVIFMCLGMGGGFLLI